MIARVLAGNAGRLTEPPKLCTKQDTQHCWAASGSGDLTCDSPFVSSEAPIGLTQRNLRIGNAP